MESVHQDMGEEKEHQCLPLETRGEIKAEVDELMEDLGLSNGAEVDLLEVASQLNIECRSYTELGIYGVLLFFHVSKYGISFLDKKTNRFVIYYNDGLSCMERQQTLAHEMGHIQREHYLMPVSEETAEAEANFYAVCLFDVIKPLCRIRARAA